VGAAAAVAAATEQQARGGNSHSAQFNFHNGMPILSLLFLNVYLLIVPVFLTQSRPAQLIGAHEAPYDAQGRLLPWIAWNTALDREMKCNGQCPAEQIPAVREHNISGGKLDGAG
jgi:hypothetical protein